MKKLKIRGKITLWFASVMVIILILTVVVELSANHRVLQQNIQEQLVLMVEDNMDEVEYHPVVPEMEDDRDVDHYITYGEGYLEIDDDYLDMVNGIYTALYNTEGELLYGENPFRDIPELIDGEVTTLTGENGDYYCYVRSLESMNLPDLWLRGVVSQHQGDNQMSSLARILLMTLPMLMLLALIGGYYIAGRSLRPVREIRETAEEISQGKDLSRRISLGAGKDELHDLADTFNDMFARLEKSFQAERQFTSDASHELRTPASVIAAQCEYSLEKPRTQEEYVEALEVISRQSGRMNRLIGDMLELSRMERNGLNLSETDLSHLVSDLSQDLSLLRERGITLDVRVQPQLTVMGDRERLMRLLSNLISNAYRYGKENGSICVELTGSDGYAVLRVLDDGIGITPKDAEKIFDRFYQTDSARSGQGAGLGLAMVREIAELHGGSVSVESRPGEGSCFNVKIPLKK